MDLIKSALFVLGCLTVATGVALLSVPVGVVVVGATLITCSILLEDARK